MEKLDGKSMNIVAENVSKMKELFPEIICEDKIDFNMLQELLGEYTEDKEERYSFNWKGKSKAVRIAQTPSTGTLRPSKEESKKFVTTKNLYIEGDNLEVLKLLQKTYNEKVKMIYIDPPYNTGNDFVYHDDFRDNIKNYLEITGQLTSDGRKIGTNSEASGRYHTDWLNMMYPRLKLARNLLSDDGVIFISIDDNELANLKIICNEIFREENCINNKNFIWHIPNGTNKGFIARAHEYILAYAKNIDCLKPFKRNLLEGNEEISEERCTNTPTSDNPTSEIKFNKGLRFEDESGIFEGVIQGKEPIEIIGKMTFENGVLKNDVILKSSWRNRDQILSYMGNGIAFDEKGQELFEIFFSKEGKPKYKKKLIYFSPKSVQIFKTSSYENSLTDMFSFNNPKPISMIEFLVSLVTDGNDIILDFFSGSATSAQAIIKKNASDNSRRKFIMVQLDENLEESLRIVKGKAKTSIEGMISFLKKVKKPLLLTEIGKERIRRSGEKILQEYKNKEGIENLDIGFKVFKLDSSNIKKWDVDSDNLEINMDNMINNFVTNRTEEDIVYEIMLKYGIDLTYPVEIRKIADIKVFSIGFGALLICLDNEITLEVVEGIVNLKDELKPEVTRVIFKDNGFKDDSVKTNAIQILRRNKIQEVMSI